MKPSFSRAIASVLIFVAALGAYAWWYGRVADKSGLASTLQSEISAKSQLAERLKSIRATLSQLSGEEALVERYFVSAATIVPFIEDLESRGKALDSQVSVLSVNPTNSKPPTFTLNLRIDGSFDAVMRTVGAIEFAPYDLTATALSLTSASSDDGKSVVWTATMSVIVGSAATTTSSTKP